MKTNVYKEKRIPKSYKISINAYTILQKIAKSRNTTIANMIEDYLHQVIKKEKLTGSIVTGK